MAKIQIGRVNAPSTDIDVDSDFEETQIEIVKDVIGMVNRCSQNKDQWYVIIDDGPKIIPTLNFEVEMTKE